MNEFFNGLIDCGYLPPVHGHKAGHAILVNQAIKQFQNSLTKGRWAKIWAILRGRQGSMCGVDYEQMKIENSYYAGLRSVPINKICGSEGKERDFDGSFHPLHERSRDRWVSILIARYQGIGLPAVELVQIGDCYFVRDGHHRISVAMALGQEEIDAEVTVWQVYGRSPWQIQQERLAPALIKRAAICRLLSFRTGGYHSAG